MITELGKFLRKLRIDNGEILKDMSEIGTCKMQEKKQKQGDRDIHIR